MVGWSLIGPDSRIADWAAAALPVAKSILAGSHDPWRCGGTWFVGVDALPNAPDGSVGQVAFPWPALLMAPEPLHRGQLSVIRPGYPAPDPSETEAATTYRRRRDAAHLDGLLAVGQPPRRFVREPHGWILGIPLNACSADASPLVVWENSPAVMHAGLVRAFAGHPPDRWADVDVTDAYTAARAEVFATCRRIVLPVLPGQATLLHRLCIHGAAPWQDAATAPEEGRIIAYFRPQLPHVQAWIADDLTA